MANIEQRMFHELWQQWWLEQRILKHFDFLKWNKQPGMTTKWHPFSCFCVLIYYSGVFQTKWTTNFEQRILNNKFWTTNWPKSFVLVWLLQFWMIYFKQWILILNFEQWWILTNELWLNKLWQKQTITKTDYWILTDKFSSKFWWIMTVNCAKEFLHTTWIRKAL